MEDRITDEIQGLHDRIDEIQGLHDRIIEEKDQTIDMLKDRIDKLESFINDISDEAYKIFSSCNNHDKRYDVFRKR